MIKPFSEQLNRLRTGEYTEEDIEELKQRIVNENAPFLGKFTHVYITNDKVREYNFENLSNLPAEKVTLIAVERKPSSLKTITLYDDEKYTGGLPKTITIAVGANVIFLRNIDV